MTTPDGTASMPVRAAATVILVRDGTNGLEALLVRRNSELAFHGGSWVFPGGRIDPNDYADGHQPLALDDAAHDQAARVAAARESQEEAGLELAIESLVPYSHWTTPPGRSRRFATWFFIGPAPAGAVTIDDGEIKDHRWFTPSAALAARAEGEIELPAPTFVSLLRLLSVADHTASQVVDAARSHPYLRFEPHPVSVEGGMISLYNGDVAYHDPALLGHSGPRHRCYMVEPWRYECSI